MTPDTPAALPPELPLREGHQGRPVRDLQQRLVRAMNLMVPDQPGYFGHATAEALKAFQQQAGLEVNGICGRESWSALIESGFALGDRPLYRRSPMLRGDDVSDLQVRLSSLGFQSGRVDGIFGPDTAEAVSQFQRNAGLVSDGIVGHAFLEQLLRMGGRTGTVTKAHVHEQLELLDGPRHLAGQRVVVAESGSLPAIANALGRRLDDAGAHCLVVHHPDGSAQAAEANRFDAHVFLAIDARTGTGCRLASYQSPGFTSMGGRHLAEMVATTLDDIDLPGEITLAGMRINVLRETRMPAVSCEVGPVSWLVENSAEIAAALTSAIGRWAIQPIEEPE